MVSDCIICDKLWPDTTISRNAPNEAPRKALSEASSEAPKEAPIGTLKILGF